MSTNLEPICPDSGFYDGRSESPIPPIRSSPREHIDEKFWSYLKVTQLPTRALGFIFTYVCDDIVNHVNMQVSRLLLGTRNVLRIVNHRITELVLSKLSFTEEDLHGIAWCYKNLQILDLQGSTIENRCRIGKQKKESFVDGTLKQAFKQRYFPRHSDLVVVGNFRQPSQGEMGFL